MDSKKNDDTVSEDNIKKQPEEPKAGQTKPEHQLERSIDKIGSDVKNKAINYYLLLSKDVIKDAKTGQYSFIKIMSDAIHDPEKGSKTGVNAVLSSRWALEKPLANNQQLVAESKTLDSKGAVKSKVIGKVEIDHTVAVFNFIEYLINFPTADREVLTVKQTMLLDGNEIGSAQTYYFTHPVVEKSAQPQSENPNTD